MRRTGQGENRLTKNRAAPQPTRAQPPACKRSGTRARIEQKAYDVSLHRHDPVEQQHPGAMLSLKYRRLPISWFYEQP